MPRPVILWRFTDGRPGHDGQSAGLARALGERLPVSVFNLEAAACRGSLRHWLLGRFPPGRRLPDPDLLVGAGHATHLPLLAARRARGGRAVLLMKPSLPARWFDLCLVPAHDRPAAAANVLVTEGALNRIRPGGGHDPERALVLLGGPSRHHGWDSQAMVQQIAALLSARPGRRWTVALSPRTPAGFGALLRGAPLEVVEAGADPDWLPAQLAAAGEVWVSEDSVSMLYEALTSGARVGVLAVPRRRQGRVALGVDALVTAGRVAPPGSLKLAPPAAEPFDEAARCAAWMERRWLNA